MVVWFPDLNTAERTWAVAEQRQHSDRLAAETVAEVCRREDPDVGAPDARGLQVGVEARVLAAMGCRDESAVVGGEDDILGLVADEQGAGDPRRIRADIDDADAVREVIDDPYLATGGCGDGVRLDADTDAGTRCQAFGGHFEDLQTRVRRVDDEQARAVGRERDGPDGPALEDGDRRRCKEQREGHGEDRDHVIPTLVARRARCTPLRRMRSISR